MPEHLKNKQKWLKAQSEFSDLQSQLVRFLQERGAHPYGLVHEHTFFNYHDFKFGMQLSFLGLKENK